MDEVIVTTESERRMALDAIRSIPLPMRITAKRHRRRRSDRQNRYYWPCFVSLFAEWLSEQQGRTVGKDEAHAVLKEAFLRVPQVNESTGEVLFLPNGDPMMRTRSTTELTTVEFNEYLDLCADLLASYCGITVPQPDEYHEPLAVAA